MLALLLGVLGQAGAPAHAREEAVLLATIEAQGGRSHASGERPELGPVVRQATVPFADVLLRVGLTPTSFAGDGSVLAEYDTAAAHNHPRVEIVGAGAADIVDYSTYQTVATLAPKEAASFVRAFAGGPIAVEVAGVPRGAFAGPLRVRSLEPGAVLVVSSMRRLNRLEPGFPLTPPPYRGELEVRASEADPARLRLVDVVDVEEYVPGVVVNESLATFHVEALRAQAIAARGYAQANRGRFAARGFDIDDSTLSQVYRGQSSETEVALKAAQSTLGLVVLRDGRLVAALYSSSMGGHTESNEYVFPSGGYPGANADPALRGVHDGEGPVPVDLTTDEGVRTFYTTVYPGGSEVDPVTGQPMTSLHRWTRTRTAAELLARLRESFGVPPSASSITDLRTLLRGHSGRMMQVAVDGDWGTTVVTGWSDLRRLATLSGTTPGGTSSASAPNSPSTYTITRDALGRVAGVLFYGGGFGHNVGMSQYGAHGRARRGQAAEGILSSYYTGVEVSTPPGELSASLAGRTTRFFSAGAGDLVVEGRGKAWVLLNGRRLQVRGRGGRELADLAPFLRPGPNDLTLLAVDSPGIVLRVSAPSRGRSPATRP